MVLRSSTTAGIDAGPTLVARVGDKSGVPQGAVVVFIEKTDLSCSREQLQHLDSIVGSGKRDSNQSSQQTTNLHDWKWGNRGATKTRSRELKTVSYRYEYEMCMDFIWNAFSGRRCWKIITLIIVIRNRMSGRRLQCANFHLSCIRSKLGSTTCTDFSALMAPPRYLPSSLVLVAGLWTYMAAMGRRSHT